MIKERAKENIHILMVINNLSYFRLNFVKLGEVYEGRIYIHRRIHY
jgi:hypothetical protein